MPETTERTEERQTLYGLATWLASMDELDSSARRTVTLTEIIEQAKLALEGEEGRTEYRVVQEHSGRLIERYDTRYGTDLVGCEELVRLLNEFSPVTPARVQISTVTRTPWVDLDEREGS